MVDNRVPSVGTSYFKAGDASGMANKMSEEKYGQGAEYFAQEVQEEETKKENFQDRSAQLRASLNGLAAANVGSIRFMKVVEERERQQKKKKRNIEFPKRKEIFEE